MEKDIDSRPEPDTTRPATEPPARRRPEPSGRALAAAYVGICLVPLVLAGARAVAPLDPWEAAGAALGLVALAAMAVQFLTSGRFEFVSGRLGIDEIMAFHKIAAWGVALALVLHPLAYVVPTFMEDPALGWERLVAYHTSPHYRTGVIALGALLILVVTAFFREKLPGPYEAWRATHVVLALVAVVAGLHHAVSVGRFSVEFPVRGAWIFAALAIALVMATLYGWRWLNLHRRPWALRSVSRQADRMWELDIRPAGGTPPLRYEAGQFVWMTEGARRFPLFDHPFSIAGSPREEGLKLLIKEAGDFTNRIGSLPEGIAIGIDGPHGGFTLARHRADAIVLIAGGVGIAPILGLLRDLAARGDDRPVRLAYAAGRPENLACLDEIEAAKQRLDLQVMLLAEEDAPGFAGEVGLLDRDRLERLLEGLDRSRTGVMMCGPGAMMTAVSDTLVDLGLPLEAVTYERFDYAGGLASRRDRRRVLQFAGMFGVLALAVAAAAFLLA